MHPHSPDESPAPRPAGSPRSIDPRRLRADDLRYLLAVSRTGRLVTAADALGVDHTTVSRRVAALEKSIGLRLIERGPDGWTLTEIGRAISDSARVIEEAIDRVVDTVEGQDSPSLHGTVRVSAPDGFGTAFATPALVRVRRQHPQLQVELITATRQLALRPSGFDLAVVIGVPSSSRLVTEHLTDYTLGLYACDDYLAEYGRPKSLAELREHPLIFYIESMLQVGDLDIERHLPGMTPAFSSTNVFAQLEATRQGAGIGVLPAFLTSGRNCAGCSPTRSTSGSPSPWPSAGRRRHTPPCAPCGPRYGKRSPNGPMNCFRSERRRDAGAVESRRSNHSRSPVAAVGIRAVA